MSIQNDIELANTREKLQRLEKRYEAINADVGADERVRELTMRSLKGTINQFKEEILRYEVGTNRQAAKRRVLSDVELENTRRKLVELERMYDAHDHEPRSDQHLHDACNQSLKKLINQLKEEIIWTEAHQPIQSVKSRA